MCNCQGWCRDWRETKGFTYPASNHAPGCEDYKFEPFVRVEYDGTFCVMEPHEAEAMVADGGGEYTTSDIQLTRDQFNNMKDFEGF